VPLAGEADLWSGGASLPPSTARRAADAARVAGAGLRPLAAAAGGSLASPAVRARAAPLAARVATAVGVASRGTGAAAPAPLSVSDAKRLLLSFFAAKRAACGPAHDAAALATAASGRLAAEWRGRAADLAADGWTLSYATKKVAVTSAPALVRGGRVVFRATVAERAVLRDAGGGAVDDGVAAYDAEFTAARGADGAWRLEGARVVG
jgi:hypothetical protein